MIIVLIITLYTSRVVLDILGAEDFGLYSSVASVATMLLFLNSTLSSGTSRFLTFEIGSNNSTRLKNTFNTTFYSHLFLALLIVLILETVGIWFINNKLVVPNGRILAANIIFQCSILTSFVSITQIPYTSVIIAHEDMSIYAYISIFDAALKLLLVYLLQILGHDKLILYAILMSVVQVIVSLLYRWFAIRKYEEARLSLSFNTEIFKNLLNFTGWNLLANLSQSFKTQGTVVLLNMFFRPAIVAAQTIATQIASQTLQLYNNFRTAINPQIIKLHAAGAELESRQFVLKTNIYVFDLCLLIALPLFLLMEPILNLWLVDVPEYTVVFAKFLVVQNVINCIQHSFYTSLLATGNLRLNSIIGFIISVISFLILYLIFKFGGSLMWIQYIYIFVAILDSFLLRPIIMYLDAGYQLKDVYRNIWQCCKVCIVSIFLVLPIKLIVSNNIVGYTILLIGSIVSVIFSSYIFIDKSAKCAIKTGIKSRIKYLKNE